MTTRIVTGAGLLALLIFGLWMGGWVFAVLWIGAVLIAIHEVFTALGKAGDRPVAWPTFAALLISIPSFLLFGQEDTVAVLVATVFFTFLTVCVIVLFRREPTLDAMLVSLLPLFSVALPCMCLLALARLPVAQQRALLALTFFVPVVGDTAAYFVGVRYGHVKLSPIVSPKKTVEGAAGGLIGSVLMALVIYLLSAALEPSLHIWHFLAIGFFGGMIGQIGDLFASIIKRHCGVKDFGNIFPGHGGMMDRLDSILFVAVFVYAYHLVLL